MRCKRCSSTGLRRKSWTPERPQDKHGNPKIHYSSEQMKLIYNRKYKGVYFCMKCGKRNRFAK